MTEPVLLRERRGRVVCATMNRPRVMNALNAALRQELATFWREFRDDSDLRVAIIAGAGDRAFSTGRDLKETASADAAGHSQGFEETGEYGYPSNLKIGKPVIAAVNGHCMAAGLMIALGSDLRICSETARFANPQVTRGRGTRIPFHLSQVGVPRAVALDMTMTGKAMDAQEALRWGLVSRVVPQATLMDEAWSIAAGIAENSPVVVTGIKRAVELGLLDLPANEAMTLWAPLTGMMGNTADAVEGAKSFAEGRKGAFRLMYGAPPIIATEVFSRYPDHLLVRARHKSLLEGPSFDREGNLFCVNVRHGQILKVSPDGTFSVVAQYEGSPNGLKIHRDGRIFVADQKMGVILIDPDAGAVAPFISAPPDGSFHGLNDLVFDASGNLYFTDQGETGLHDRTGRLWRYKVDGTLELLLDCIPSPNGLIPAPDERIIYLAVTRANAVWRVPIRHNSMPGRVGMFIQMSGGVGPDGMAQDRAGNIFVAHPGIGSVWMFDPDGRPLAEIRSCEGKMTTNIAFGGPDNRTLFIMEAASGSILTARLDTPGKSMFSHS